MSTEKTWDGRGDKLADARLSLMSGRAADDLRLKGTHWRVLAHVGRQNHKRGWLRLSQSELATLWECSRQSVNSAVSDLVDWGYLLKRDQKETGESFCTYKVRLDDEDDDDGVTTAGDTPPSRGVSTVRDTPPRRGVSPPDDTSVKRGATPVSGEGDTPSLYSNRLSPTDAELPLPRPPAPGGKPVGGRGKIEWIEDLREEGIAPLLLDDFFGKLVDANLGTWKSVDGGVVDPRGPARQICRDLEREPVAVVEALREAILDSQKYRLPTVRAVREMLPAVRVEVERDRALGRTLAETPSIEVSALASQRFLDAFERIDKHQRKSWFEHGGVAKVDDPPGFIEIVSQWPGKLIDQYLSSNVRAAIRMAFNKDLEPRYVRGRAVTSKGAAA